MSMKKKSSTLKIIFVMTIILLTLVLSYLYIQTRTTPLINRKDGNKSELEILLTKDIESGYPNSPRKLVELYSRYAKGMFNEKPNDKEIETLADKIRLLFDDELLLNNPLDTYLIELKTEITSYRKANRTMMNYVIQSSDGIQYWTKDKVEYAYVIASYTLKENSDYTKIYEKFLIRKDSDGNWKILGWEIAEEVDLTSKAE